MQLTLAQAEIEMIKSIAPLYGLAEAHSIVRIVWEDVLHIKNKANHSDKVMLRAELSLLDNITNRLVSGEPLQYILGKADFFGCKFIVTPSVLIPRMETEELVAAVIQSIKGKSKPTVLDIGTGSGCIAITLSKKCPSAQVYATDISKAALLIAQCNNDNLQASVQFIEHDACSDSPLLPDIQWDAIVSNPPYIPLSEMEIMPTWVVAHEPHLALFVKNDNPLVFYKKIINFASKTLKTGGELWMECNQYNALSLLALPLAKQYFTDAAILQDLSGNDRMFRAIRT